MAHHLKLVFHGYVDVRNHSTIYVVKYVLGKRDPHLLSFSRWYQAAPTYYWGVWSDETQKQACSQLAWTLLFAFLVKQTNLTDSRTTANLVTEDLVSKFVQQTVSKFPPIWWLPDKTIAKFLFKNSQIDLSPTVQNSQSPRSKK